MEKCEKLLRDVTLIMEGRTNLSEMQERYSHECMVHNDASSCEALHEITRSLRDRTPLDNTLQDFVKCITEEIIKCEAK